MNKKLAIITGAGVVILAIAGGVTYDHYRTEHAVKQTATRYVTAFASQKSTQLAQQVDTKHLKGYTAKSLATRNTAAFTRMGVSKIRIANQTVKKQSSDTYSLRFTAAITTKIGQLKPQHYHTTIVKDGQQWRVRWSPKMILPSMSGKDVIQLRTVTATRGQIYDRNHQLLAKNGKRVQAGIIPGNLGSGAKRNQNLQKIATAWNVKLATLKTLVNQSWVTPKTLVPVKVVTKTPTLAGVDYQTVDSRTYPLGSAAAQLIGYVGQVTADDIKKNPQLTSADVIGKAGLEQTYNKRLSGTDGGVLYLQNGDETTTLLQTQARPGKDLTLTIDAAQQKKAYQQLGSKAGSVVTMNPNNGQLLVLASSPSYDPNKFVNGISQTDYDQYANDKNLPFVSRFTQRYAPGSTFKMLTAAIALQNRTITSKTTKSINGLKWQKDASWGSYQVTRTVADSRENMTQALVNSDNIWFAQVALKMGASAYLKGLDPLFKTQSSLPLTMAKAQISNSGKLDRDTLLADTAYGQGQLLLSPIQQATMYSAIANHGIMQQPTLIKGVKAKRTRVFAAQDSAKVETALTHVVSDATGTAHGLALSGHTIAAKTGTAELKQTQDTNGKTNGFLAVMDADKNTYLTVSLMENSDSGTLVTAMKPYVKTLY